MRDQYPDLAHLMSYPGASVVLLYGSFEMGGFGGLVFSLLLSVLPFGILLSRRKTNAFPRSRPADQS